MTSLSGTCARTRRISSALASGLATDVFVEALVIRTKPNRFIVSRVLPDLHEGLCPIVAGPVLLRQRCGPSAGVDGFFWLAPADTRSKTPTGSDEGLDCAACHRRFGAGE